MTESDEIKALQERIAKAKAERAAFEEASEKRAEIARLEREAKREEQAVLDAPYIAKAVEEYGDRMTVVETNVGAIILKKPHHRKFNETVQKGEKITTDEATSFVKTCCVYPEWERVEEILREYPGVLGALFSACISLGTAGAKERSGK